MTEESLFVLVLATPEAERAAMLDRECGGNPELRARVEALLRIGGETSGFGPDTLPAVLTRLAALPAPQAADAARADQDARWRAGGRPPAEAYLAGLPAVAADPDQAMVLLYGEVLARAARGESPAEGEYTSRFPHLAARIADLFAVHAALHPDRHSTADGPDTLTTGPADGGTTHAGTPTEPSAGVAEVIGPYRLLGELGRGGMGLVYAARDPSLDREVAVKTLFPGRPSLADAAARFVREALITAKLPHPNIPPVYALGERPDGTPYLAMKLVRGHTLEHLLRDRPHPAAGLPRFVGVFEQVCQAVGFAHSQRVVHRDLKPNNVMVGAFGEVQVMDWGLAKDLTGGVVELSSADAEASGPITPNAGRAETLPGSILGTPAYMAPEQARGEPPGPRADVFALGGLLCAILTGQPTFVAADVRATWRLATAADTADALARLAGCGADPDLIALAQRCLSADPADRPADAGEVAQLVAAHRAGVEERARQAELDRERAEVEGSEQGKRRRVWQWAGGITTAVLLIAITGVTAGLLQVREAKRRESDRADGERKQKELAEAATVAERAAKVSESVERGKAEYAYEKTADVLDLMVSEIAGESLATQKAISPEQKKFLTEVLKHYKEFARGSATDERSRYRIARAAYQVGLIEDRLGRIDQSCAAFRAACDAFAALAAEHPTPFYRRWQALSHRNLGTALTRLRRLPEAAEHLRTARDRLERLVADFPSDRKVAADLAQCYDDLGNQAVTRGEVKDAAEQFRLATALLEKLVGIAPVDPKYRGDLAAVYNNHGGQLSKLGELKKAQERYERAVDLYEQLLNEFPDRVSHCVNLARALGNLGRSLGDTEDRVTGCDHLRRSRRMLEKVTAEFPSVPAYRDDLAASCDSLGKLLGSLGHLPESRESFLKAQSIWEGLIGGPTPLPKYRFSLSNSHASFGLLLRRRDDLPAAHEQLRTAIAINEKLVSDYPTDSRYQTALGGEYCNYGSLVRDAGDPADSLKWFEKAIRTLTAPSEGVPREGQTKQFLRFSFLNRADAHDRLKRYAEAVKDWERGLELSPKAEQPRLRALRAASLLHAGRVADAVTEVADLTKTANWKGTQWYWFAATYSVASVTIEGKKAEYSERAVALLRKAVAAGYKDHPWMAKDADLDPLRGREDFKTLLADLKKKFPLDVHFASP